MEEKEYDVVLDTLQKAYDKLHNITYRCCELEWGATDFIRLEQMSKLTDAMILWQKHKVDNL
jgi:hypothetical protein